MRRILAASMLVLSSVVARGQELPIAHAGPDFAERAKADSIVRTLVDRFHLPGISVALARDDRLVYAAAIGWADQKKRVPMATTTRMRLASVSKPLTSLALMTLEER